eukprot:m.134355 g.134355  ORF g.134355 m.134355 type:complete len:317 (-) comp29736_c1_seq1:399-1349(-)
MASCDGERLRSIDECQQHLKQELDLIRGRVHRLLGRIGNDRPTQPLDKQLLNGDFKPHIRYIFRGGTLKNGSIVFLGPEKTVYPAAILQKLKDRNMNLDRIKASFYSLQYEGWVSLEDESEPFLFTKESPRLDVLLEDRSMHVTWSSTWSHKEETTDDKPALGYFGIGIYKGKSEENQGTLWRSAYQTGASFLFSIGARFRREYSDTVKSWKRIPFFEYKDFNAFAESAPVGAPWVAVEIGGEPLESFQHPRQAVYILGSEDTGLPTSLLRACAYHIALPAVHEASYNVAVAGSIILYDRLAKTNINQAKARKVHA